MRCAHDTRTLDLPLPMPQVSRCVSLRLPEQQSIELERDAKLFGLSLDEYVAFICRQYQSTAAGGVPF